MQNVRDDHGLRERDLQTQARGEEAQEGEDEEGGEARARERARHHKSLTWDQFSFDTLLPSLQSELPEGEQSHDAADEDSNAAAAAAASAAAALADGDSPHGRHQAAQHRGARRPSDLVFVSGGGDGSGSGRGGRGGDADHDAVLPQSMPWLTEHAEGSLGGFGGFSSSSSSTASVSSSQAGRGTASPGGGGGGGGGHRRSATMGSPSSSLADDFDISTLTASLSLSDALLDAPVGSRDHAMSGLDGGDGGNVARRGNGNDSGGDIAQGHSGKEDKEINIFNDSVFRPSPSKHRRSHTHTAAAGYAPFGIGPGDYEAGTPFPKWDLPDRSGSSATPPADSSAAFLRMRDVNGNVPGLRAEQLDSFREIFARPKENNSVGSPSGSPLAGAVSSHIRSGAEDCELQGSTRSLGSQHQQHQHQHHQQSANDHRYNEDAEHYQQMHSHHDRMHQQYANSQMMMGHGGSGGSGNGGHGSHTSHLHHHQQHQPQHQPQHQQMQNIYPDANGMYATGAYNSGPSSSMMNMNMNMNMHYQGMAGQPPQGPSDLMMHHPSQSHMVPQPWMYPGNYYPTPSGGGGGGAGYLPPGMPMGAGMGHGMSGVGSPPPSPGLQAHGRGSRMGGDMMGGGQGGAGGGNAGGSGSIALHRNAQHHSDRRHNAGLMHRGKAGGVSGNGTGGMGSAGGSGGGANNNNNSNNNSNNSNNRNSCVALLEYRASGTQPSADELKGHVVEFARDAAGSRYLQYLNESASDDVKRRLVDEICTNAVTLMQDTFGNYVVQNYLERSPTDAREKIGLCMKGHMMDLSSNAHGTRVVQRAITLLTIGLRNELLGELVLSPDSLGEAARNSFATHCIQKVMAIVLEEEKERRKRGGPEEKPENGAPSTAALLAAAERAVDLDFVALSKHAHSYRLVLSVLDDCDEERSDAMKSIFAQLATSQEELAKDQHANFVLQHLLMHGESRHQEMVQAYVAANVVELSMLKFSSHLVEKCLACAKPKQVERLVSQLIEPTGKNLSKSNELLSSSHSQDAPTTSDRRGGSRSRTSSVQHIGDDNLLMLMQDPYANFVVQRAFDRSQGALRERLSGEIHQRAELLQRFTYGRHILLHINRVSGGGGGGSGNGGSTPGGGNGGGGGHSNNEHHRQSRGGRNSASKRRSRGNNNNHH